MYSCWVADDRVLLTSVGNSLVARPADRLSGLAEHRLVGILPVNHLSAMCVDCIVDLIPRDDIERLPEDEKTLLGKFNIELPLILSPMHAPDRAVSIVDTQISRWFD